MDRVMSVEIVQLAVSFLILQMAVVAATVPLAVAVVVNLDHLSRSMIGVAPNVLGAEELEIANAISYVYEPPATNATFSIKVIQETVPARLLLLALLSALAPRENSHVPLQQKFSVGVDLERR